MTRRLFYVLLPFALLSCAQAPPPTTAPDPATAAPSTRVVLVSFDGVGFDALAEQADGLGTDGWNRIRREGVTARMIPVNPTLTSVTHVAMATGAQPSRSGVVSNTLHLPGTPPTEWASGFDVAIDTDTIWQAASRAGKRVGAITYPGLDGTTPERTADFGLIYTQPVSRSRLESIDRSEFQPDPILSRFVSFSPILVSRRTWRWSLADRNFATEIDLIALDTTNDGEKNYDDFVVRQGDVAFEVGDDRWFPLSVEIDENGSPHLFGSWSKILAFHPELDSLQLYWGPVSRTRGYPDSFRRLIDLEVGFWPGPPDDWAAVRWLDEREGIDPQTFVEQLERFSDFFTRATLLAMNRMRWDLLLSYQPIVDEAEHQWHLVLDRQLFSTPENRAAGAAVRASAFRAFDTALAELLEAADPTTSIVVVADHGLTALHTGVQINGLLVDWGYAVGAGRNPAPESRWAAYASGGVAHLHRFGAADPGEIETLIRRLLEVRSPEGEIVFERVERTGPSAHPREGIIVAYLLPGFAFQSGVEGERFRKTTYFGQHGYLNHHSALHPIFGAWGAGVPARFPETIDQTEVAGWVSRLLDIPPPLQK